MKNSCDYKSKTHVYVKIMLFIILLCYYMYPLLAKDHNLNILSYMVAAYKLVEYILSTAIIILNSKSCLLRANKCPEFYL